MTITVNIGGSKKQQDKVSAIRVSVTEENLDLNEYCQIDKTFLKFLHKSWVKVVSTKKILQTTGGFVAKCEEDCVMLRVPAKKEIFEIMFEETTLFYVKNDDENYKSVVEMKVEQSKAEFLAMKKELLLDKKIKEIEILRRTLEKKLSKS